MGVKCANENHPDFKRIVGLSNNETATRIVWDNLNGDLSSIKTKEDFNKALLVALDNTSLSEKEVSKQKKGTGKPLSKFSKEQKDEIVDNLIFLSVWDGIEQTIKDPQDITVEELKTFILCN